MYKGNKTNKINLKALVRQFLNIYKAVGLINLLIYLIKAINDTYIKKYVWGSFSQKGEDLILEQIFGKKKSGFYIDVGAHNPNVFNNTKRFYQKGWQGINIEPNPRLIKEFLKQRHRDINLHMGIGKTSSSATFFEFDADSLSTFSKIEADKNVQLGYKIKQILKIPIWTLAEVIQKYGTRDIDFISIDTEGLDLEVLESNNWKKFRPKVVCVETGNFFSIITGKEKNSKKEAIDAIMNKNMYKAYYDNGLNTIYLDNKNYGQTLS